MDNLKTNEQKTLAEYMGILSEENYRAGWMSNLEYDLWAIIKEKTQKRFATGYSLEPYQIENLQRLSDLCGGWICFSEEGESFIPLNEWINKFREWEEKQGVVKIYYE